MPSERSEEALLEKARAEENYLESLLIYEQAAKSCINKKNIAKAMEIYVEILNTLAFEAYTVKTTEEYLNSMELLNKIFKDGTTFFRQTGNDTEALECEAAMLWANANMEDSILEVEKSLNKALELCSKLHEIHSKGNNQESLARILMAISSILMGQTLFCKDPKELEELGLKAMNFVKMAWRLSMDIGNARYIALSITNGWLSFFALSQLIKIYTFDKLKILLSRCEESLKIIEECKDSFAPGEFYSTYGWITGLFGLRHIEDDREQRKYFDKGMKFLEMSLDFARKAKDKRVIVNSIFFLNFCAIISGKVMYFQKRIINDLKEVEEAGKIFVDSTPLMYRWAGFSADYLPVFYYSNIALWSFFTPTQRKSYAKKGIEHALKILKKNILDIWNSFLYLSLTILYSVLARFSASLEEQKEHSKEMLKYAKEANKIGEKYGGGEPQVLGYSSLYRAYRTFADIANTEEEKIKMLSIAADVAKKSLAYGRIESRTGIIAAQMRLGLLHEEIGILTKKTDTLMEAKELLLNALKGCHERGYHSYAATTHEYIARIEDRLGNHTASAESYKNAQETYAKSLNSIEYKPLKRRVQEKIEYVRAWNLIETAKAYHKGETHLKAKSNYEEASEILKKIHRYNYEALYYSAWASLEEAEELSKQEKQKDAINQYTMTIKAFENAIKTLIEASTKSKEQTEKERINKLEKVAKIRINYCSARINLEEALILGKKGEHSTAAEKFAMAASIFRSVCTRYKLERERKELEAIYYLCRAWESMELAEKFEEPERFEYAAKLFTKASNLFADTKLKFLASGNSAFCQALELGCKFDESFDIMIKTDLYPKVKLMLSKAASSYGKGGFENVADWALATSIYFDAAWHLIQADQASDLSEKGKLLGIGSNYLKSALELFGKAGYKNKEAEVQDRLNRVVKEESILFSALSTIKEPSISRSTMGIVAPSCPIESSQSPRLSEARQLIEEERRVAIEKTERKKYALIYRDLFKEYPRVQKRECRVAIAQIGVSKSGNIMGEFYEMKPSGLLGLREDKVELVRSRVKDMIEKAHNEGVNILLFPEMTIDLNYGELLGAIADLAKLYEMYIIPGSYHDQDTKRNISMVFGPEGILWEQEKHIPALINIGHGKHFKEGIEVERLPRKSIVCNTEYGRIVIAICRDFLDMDLRVELKNFEPPVDIILNPAFTPVTADFKAAHFDARRSIYAYCFFANVAEFGESLIYTPEKDRTERIIPSKQEGLIYKDIDIFKLRSERKKWEKEQKKDVQFIQSTR